MTVFCDEDLIICTRAYYELSIIDITQNIKNTHKMGHGTFTVCGGKIIPISALQPALKLIQF